MPGLTASKLKTENNHSLTIRVDYGASSFLWTGDMEAPALKLLVARYKTNKMLDVHVYEAGHHGAENGVTQPLIDAISPDLAIISVGHRRRWRLQDGLWLRTPPYRGSADAGERCRGYAAHRSGFYGDR